MLGSSDRFGMNRTTRKSIGRTVHASPKSLRLQPSTSYRWMVLGLQRVHISHQIALQAQAGGTLEPEMIARFHHHQMLWKEPAAAERERPGRRAHLRPWDSATSQGSESRPRGLNSRGGTVRDAPGARAGVGVAAHPAVGGHRLSRSARGLGRPTCVSALAVLRHTPAAAAVARMRLVRQTGLKRPGGGGRVVAQIR